MHRNAGWNLNAVFCQHGQRLGAGGVVRHGGTGGNDREIVARHIGNRECGYARWCCCDSETTAFDCGQMFAHRIHFGNIRAAFQQGTADDLFVGKRYAICGQGEQRGTTTRNQDQNEIVRRQP